jgi:hypothetical protein
MFHRHAEILLEEERPKLASVLGAMEQLPSRAGKSSVFFFETQLAKFSHL